MTKSKPLWLTLEESIDWEIANRIIEPMPPMSEEERALVDRILAESAEDAAKFCADDYSKSKK
jgi:hypothetical protein